METPRVLAEGGEHVEEGRRGLGAIPGTDEPAGGAALLEAGGVPEQDQIVDEAGQRGGAGDRGGGLILRVFEAEELLLVAERDLDRPPPGVALQDEGMVDGEAGPE